MAKDNIKTNPRLRLAGWRKAVKSRNTPPWLKKSMRKNIRDLEKRLRSKKVDKGGNDRPGARDKASILAEAQRELPLSPSATLSRNQ